MSNGNAPVGGPELECSLHPTVCVCVFFGDALRVSAHLFFLRDSDPLPLAQIKQHSHFSFGDYNTFPRRGDQEGRGRGDRTFHVALIQNCMTKIPEQ